MLTKKLGVAFKLAVRNFNSFKNSFYKEIKKRVKNGTIRKTLVKALIQDEWKQIGHVPRKYSDKIWKSSRCL
jgi:hypothetical protein